jgi:hypothetical protein
MTHTVTRYRRLAGPLAALLSSGLLLGACGGSDDTARKGGAAEQPDATRPPGACASRASTSPTRRAARGS